MLKRGTHSVQSYRTWF